MKITAFNPQNWRAASGGTRAASRRPSVLLRGAWAAVALLHVWLIARRFVAGDWAGPVAFLNMSLCVAAIGYASLKFWRVSTIFDASPGRAWVFALLLVLGHTMIQAPGAHAANSFDAQPIAIVLTVATALGAALILRAKPRSTLADFQQFLQLEPVRIADAHIDARLPRELLRGARSLLRRPPPASAR